MRLAGIEPANPKRVPDFKSGAYTNSAISAGSPTNSRAKNIFNYPTHTPLPPPINGFQHPTSADTLDSVPSPLSRHGNVRPKMGLVRSASTRHWLPLGRAYALRVLILMHYPVFQRSPPVSRTPFSWCPCLADNLIKAHHLNGAQPLRPKFSPGNPQKGA